LGEGFDLASKDFFPKLIDVPLDPGLLPLRRLGCKMATGSGKTVVMAMLVSWAFCNRGVNPSSRGYPNAVLVCCPNLTVKERLQVLRPDSPDNYYAAFDLVPVDLRPHLQGGKVLVENWHRFAPESEHKERDKSYAVVNKGPETPETLARRVLGDLYERLPIMVLNDEGHHCWRPAPAGTPIPDEGQPKKGKKAMDGVTAEEKAALEDEADEARVWLQGLDWINNCLGAGRPDISMAVDLSATPFSIKGSGYPEGQPFAWLVSDFGLVDAIESGIVKIPRLSGAAPGSTAPARQGTQEPTDGAGEAGRHVTIPVGYRTQPAVRPPAASSPARPRKRPSRSEPDVPWGQRRTGIGPASDPPRAPSTAAAVQPLTEATRTLPSSGDAARDPARTMNSITSVIRWSMFLPVRSNPSR
jgi:hypothetical protein